MLGALIGDIAGSVYEFNPIKIKEFLLFDPLCRFTDDTVMSIAVAHAVLERENYSTALRKYGRRYSQAGYGPRFQVWLQTDRALPYNSFGNGAAMRVSPVGWAFDDIEQVLAEARKSAEVSHNHPEGVKGAQATALAIFMARKGASKADIRREVTERFGYNLDRRLDDIRPDYQFDVTCQGTVPEAIISFLEADDYEDTIRNAISLGGDSDTLACIAGGIAEAFFGEIPASITETAIKLLPQEFLTILRRFYHRFAQAYPPGLEAH